MLIDFSFGNFRSVKERQTLSLEAENRDEKSDNFHKSKRYKDLRLLKSAVIYGANASGKSNIIRAFYTLQRFILNSGELKNGDPIRPYYDPFLLDKHSGEPIFFSITFLNSDGLKYAYEVRFDVTEILFEKLDVFYSERASNLFLREKNKIKLGAKLKDKKVERKILKNHLFLSKIGNSPHEQAGSIYLYFKRMEIWNTGDSIQVSLVRKAVEERMADDNNADFRERLGRLIRIADTKIESLSASQIQLDTTVFPLFDDPDFRSHEQITHSMTKVKILAEHKVFDDGGKEVGRRSFDFLEKESEGTVALFSLGGLMLKTLDEGGIIVFDEFDNSLHPLLSRFLVQLFLNPVSNTKNAQLIFATHETNLLDRTLFRRDQIWFTEKNQAGQTDLYSIIDFDDLPEKEVPLDKWYLNGKFGGHPRINEMEFIYGKDS